MMRIKRDLSIGSLLRTRRGRAHDLVGACGAPEGQRARRRRLSRRGVASVLAMMFVVLFGSLAVAMAIVSKGNLRTAQTNLHVIRAMGAADTGVATRDAAPATSLARAWCRRPRIG